MAGILPITFHKKKIFFLLARESKDATWKGAGKWSDFGGGREKNETLKETAIREGFEETMGVFGTIKEIRHLMKHNLTKKFTVNNYTTFVIEVPYTKELPKIFRKDYLHTFKNNKKLVTDHNGLYEKDMLKWVELKNVKEMYPKLRTWYKPMLSKIYEHFNKME
tara:strand:+ start:1395 stop:1886 length:492 start_codon:yes stop_codon:yes gene_type:complete